MDTIMRVVQQPDSNSTSDKSFKSIFSEDGSKEKGVGKSQGRSKLLDGGAKDRVTVLAIRDRRSNCHHHEELLRES